MKQNGCDYEHKVFENPMLCWEHFLLFPKYKERVVGNMEFEVTSSHN